VAKRQSEGPKSNGGCVWMLLFDLIVVVGIIVMWFLRRWVPAEP
jgi:hypothetical protein